MSFDPGLLRDLAAHERAVMQHWRERVAPPEDARLLQPGGGGVAGVTIETVKIVAIINRLGAASNAFSCKRLDEDGEVFGPAFDVYAFSKTDQNFSIGFLPVAQCLPSYAVGDYVRVMQQRVWTGEGWVDDYWTVDTLVLSPCEAG